MAVRLVSNLKDPYIKKMPVGTLVIKVEVIRVGVKLSPFRITEKRRLTGAGPAVLRVLTGLNHMFSSWEYFTDFIRGFQTIDLWSRIDSRDLIKGENGRNDLLDFLGASPKTLHKQFRKIICNIFCLDATKNYHKYCLSKYFDKQSKKVKWMLDFEKIKNLKTVINTVRQLDKDGLMNLYPLVIRFKKDPAKLREMFGKSLWKKITKNSTTRNFLICSQISAIAERGLSCLLAIPSTVLKYDSPLCTVLQLFPSPESIYNFLKLQRKLGRKLGAISTVDANHYRDMLNMTASLKLKTPNPKTWGEVNRLHDRYQEKILENQVKNISDKPIINAEFPPIGIGPWHFNVLNSEIDYYLEGRKMHHCISSYTNSAKQFSYLTVHAFNMQTQEESTIGINMRLRLTYEKCGRTNSVKPAREFNLDIEQHHGVCNRSVQKLSSEEQKELLTYLVKCINYTTEEDYKSMCSSSRNLWFQWDPEEHANNLIRHHRQQVYWPPFNVQHDEPGVVECQRLDQIARLYIDEEEIVSRAHALDLPDAGGC